MAYTTETILISRMPKLVKTPDMDTMISGYITSAQAIIDSKAGTRYSVPFDYNGATVPALIQEIATMLCQAWVMRDLFNDYPSEKESKPANLEDRAMKLLQGVYDGTMPLNIIPDDNTVTDSKDNVTDIPINQQDDTKFGQNNVDNDKKELFHTPGIIPGVFPDPIDNTPTSW